jgi:hypothetical protein
MVLQHYHTGLPLHRQEKLENVFHLIDKVGARTLGWQATHSVCAVAGGADSALLNQLAPAGHMHIHCLHQVPLPWGMEVH